MKEKRFSSKLKQKQLETKHLEEQTKKMEDKLSLLKQQIEEQKKMRSQMYEYKNVRRLDSTITRWQKATRNTNGSLKSYAKQILEQQKQAYNQFGINQKKILGTKTFQGAIKQIKAEKEVEEDRNPTKITTFLNEDSQNIPSHLQNNFFKAKLDVQTLIKQKTLQEFLQENYILEYLPRLKEANVNDLQDLKHLSRENLQQMGIKAGHQVKIIKKVKEEFDKMNGNFKETHPSNSGQKVESGYGEGDVHQEGSKNDPSFIPIQSKMGPSENESEQSQEQRDTVMITVPMQSINLQVEDERVNCYECYRTIFGEVRWKHQQKHFCSENCLQKFMSQLRKRCPGCGSVFLKTDGFRDLGCCPNQQQLQEMFFEWHRGGK